MASINILFHGNCIDGWFSAYIAHSFFKNDNNGNNGKKINLYPISPNQPNTWPNSSTLSSSNILLLDVSVPQLTREKWLKDGALIFVCIAHHISAIEHWPIGACPINTQSCTAIQTWQKFYPGIDVPFWIHHIDRIDRWDNPTYEDRCVREVLNEIAHKPVQKKLVDAFALTDLFIMNMSTPVGVMMVLAQGKQILDKKDAELLGILNKGAIYTITLEHISMWNLPNSWLNIIVFTIDNTNITLDTTEAAHLLFHYYPQVQVFINYRMKALKGGQKCMIVYSARSRGFDLTEGSSILRGHKTSAGASLISGEAPVLPFLISPVI